MKSERSSMERVEVTLEKRKIYSFLRDMIKLCNKHNVNIYRGYGNEVEFKDWDTFRDLEIDGKDATIFWPRIGADLSTTLENK